MDLAIVQIKPLADESDWQVWKYRIEFILNCHAGALEVIQGTLVKPEILVAGAEEATRVQYEKDLKDFQKANTNAMVVLTNSMTEETLQKTIQRKFLLFSTGAYRTTPTAALQSITGILLLYVRAEQEAVYVRVARLRRREYSQGEEVIPEDFEAKDPYLRQHLAKFDLDNRINLSPHNTDSKGLNIYTDGSKMEGNAGSASVALQDNTQLYE
ncbi:hypothetical protein AVEN_78525-1 [Araneus ventricosus]|uniref:Uncharacterized protein n=1 Tax=Araneus ventricosus TaxID=182803 RepID=A0A4Y2ELI5_ARAVE|nr:hypothetical protein AVEN_78525-1 [Araneus ventricosus]